MILKKKLSFAPLSHSRRGGGGSQTLCGIVWEEFISRLTTVIELDLQLRFAVNISLLAQW